jgi:hypothetical protein
MMAEAGETNAALLELDHIAPLELGGAPLDRRNLVLPPWAGECNARQKDQLEHTLSRLVCAGPLSLADAQAEIARDWEASYSDRIDAAGCERD